MQNHKWQEDLITNIIEDIKKAFLDKGNTDLHILDMESTAYDSLRRSNELGNAEGLISEKFPSFAEVEAEVKHMLEYNEYVIYVVNSEDPGKMRTLRKGLLLSECRSRYQDIKVRQNHLRIPLLSQFLRFQQCNLCRGNGQTGLPGTGKLSDSRRSF